MSRNLHTGQIETQNYLIARIQPITESLLVHTCEARQGNNCDCYIDGNKNGYWLVARIQSIKNRVLVDMEHGNYYYYNDFDGNYLIARIQPIRDCMLVDVKCGKRMIVIVLLMTMAITLLPEFRPLETACWWMWSAASLNAISYFSSGANRSYIIIMIIILVMMITKTTMMMMIMTMLMVTELRNVNSFTQSKYFKPNSTQRKVRKLRQI